MQDPVQTIPNDEARLEELCRVLENVFLPDRANAYRTQRAGGTAAADEQACLLSAGLPLEWLTLKKEFFLPANRLLEDLFPSGPVTAYDYLLQRTELLNARQCKMLLCCSLNLSPKADPAFLFGPWERGDTLRVVRRLRLLNRNRLALNMSEGTLYAICGKIAAGKTTYAHALCRSVDGVELSMDEMTYKLIDNQQGPFYDSFCIKARDYLLEQSLTYLGHGVNVILDWGFWTKADRASLREFCRTHGIRSVLHYIDISDAQWERNIDQRNRTVLEGRGGSAFYVNEGLREKLLRLWEEPEPDEIDLRVPFTRHIIPEI